MTVISADETQLVLMRRLQDRREVLLEQFDPALIVSGSMVNLHVSGEAGLRASRVLEVD